MVLVPIRGSKSPDEGHSSGNGRKKQGSTLQGKISPFGSIQDQSSCVPHRSDMMEGRWPVVYGERPPGCTQRTSAHAVCCWARRGGPDINAASQHLGGQRQTFSRPHSLLWWNKGRRSLQTQFPLPLSSGIHSCFCLSRRHLLIIPYLPGAERNSDRSAPCSVTGDTGMLSSLISSM